MAGCFITFEGGEGSGKTTQIALLAEKLRGLGHEVVRTREPGGTPEAERVRALLVERDGGDWTPEAELLLLYAARVQHVTRLIKPALAQGKIVISDRFSDSTRAYQGFGHGLHREMIARLHRLVLEDFEPDITLILDIDPAEGLERSHKRLTLAHTATFTGTEDRFENLELAFHTRLREGFLEIARQDPSRCKVFNAAQEQMALAGEIATHVLLKLGRG